MAKRTEHATKHAKASIKEAIGMIIGDRVVQAEGAAEKMSKAGQGSDIASPDPENGHSA